jgi:hypothetical protein
MKSWKLRVGIVCGMVLAAVVAAWLHRQWFWSKASRLHTGMTQEQVISIMGSPDHTIEGGGIRIALFTPLPRFAQEVLADPDFGSAQYWPVYIEFQMGSAVVVRLMGQDKLGSSL